MWVFMEEMGFMRLGDEEEEENKKKKEKKVNFENLCEEV